MLEAFFFICPFFLKPDQVVGIIEVKLGEDVPPLRSLKADKKSGKGQKTKISFRQNRVLAGDGEGQIMPTTSHWCKSPWPLSLGPAETTASLVVLRPTDRWRRHRVDGEVVGLALLNTFGGQNIPGEANMDSWERQSGWHKGPHARMAPVEQKMCGLCWQTDPRITQNQGQAGWRKKQKLDFSWQESNMRMQTGEVRCVTLPNKCPFTMLPSPPLSMIVVRERETVGRRFWIRNNGQLMVVTGQEMGLTTTFPASGETYLLLGQKGGLLALNPVNHSKTKLEFKPPDWVQ